MKHWPFCGWVLAAQIAGTVLAAACPWPLRILLACTTATAFIALCSLLLPGGRTGGFLVLLAVFLFAWSGSAVRLQQRAPEWVTALAGRMVGMEGHVDRIGRKTASGWAATRVRIDRVDSRPVSPVLVEVIHPPGPALWPGVRVRCSGIPAGHTGPANPGDADPRLLSRIKGVEAVIKAWDEPPLVLAVRRGSLWPVLVRVRDYVERFNRRTIPGDYSGVLNGLLLGEREIRPDWQVVFQRCGLMHVMTVSGFHVALLAAAAVVLLKRLGIPGLWPSAGAIPMVASYLVLTGLKASGCRAGIFFILGWFAGLGKRHINPVRMLVPVAAIMLAANPLLLFDAGFQLSFAATWGVIQVGPALMHPLQGRPLRCRGLLGAIACSAGALLSTGPLTAYYFGLFTPVAVISNLVMLPLVSAALYLGLSALILGSFLPVAAGLNTVTAGILKLLVLTADWLARLPFAWFAAPAPGVWFLAGYYGLLFVAVYLFSGRCRGASRKYTAVAGIAAVILLFAGTTRWWDSTTELAMLDVGQGNAAVIRSARGVGLVDGGPPGPAGEAVILRVLRHWGIKRVSYVILTHAHQDHYGGISDVMNGLEVRNMLVAADTSHHPGHVGIAALAAEKGIPLSAARAGSHMATAHGTFRFYWPPAGFHGDENASSLVFCLEAEKRRVLFTGDCGTPELDRITREQDGLLKADVLAVPHHGSANSHSNSFYDAVSPSLGIVSVGPNRYGHPSGRILDALRSTGAHIWQTPDTGAVILRFTPHGAHACAWKHRGLFGLWLWRGPFHRVRIEKRYDADRR